VNRYYNNKRKQQTFPISRYLFFTGALLIILLLYLWQKTENDALRIRIEDLKMKKANLHNINQHLQLELEHLIKLSNIDRTASEKLGMKYPKDKKNIPAIEIPEYKIEENYNLKSAKSF
jgi:cell division protein FtsL